MGEAKGQKQWSRLPEVVWLISSCACTCERMLVSSFGFVFSQHNFSRAKSKHPSFRFLLWGLNLRSFVCLALSRISPAFFSFEQSVSLSSPCAGVTNHASLLKEGEIFPFRDKTGSQTTTRSKHSASPRERRAHPCLRVMLLEHVTVRAVLQFCLVWGQADSFLSRACADSAGLDQQSLGNPRAPGWD